MLRELSEEPWKLLPQHSENSNSLYHGGHHLNTSVAFPSVRNLAKQKGLFGRSPALLSHLQIQLEELEELALPRCCLTHLQSLIKMHPRRHTVNNQRSWTNRQHAKPQWACPCCSANNTTCKQTHVCCSLDVNISLQIFFELSILALSLDLVPSW